MGSSGSSMSERPIDHTTKKSKSLNSINDNFSPEKSSKPHGKMGSLGRMFHVKHMRLHRLNVFSESRKDLNRLNENENNANRAYAYNSYGKQSGQRMRFDINPDDLDYLMDKTQLSPNALMKIFNQFAYELDERGNLDKSQFVRLYCNLREESKEKIARIAEFAFNAFDRKKQGKINFKDFIVAFALTTRGSIKDKLEYTFDLYDIDQNGYLDVEEIKCVLNAMLILLDADNNTGNTDAIANQCINLLDKEKDGRITRGKLILLSIEPSQQMSYELNH